MSNANVKFVQDLYAAFKRRDLQTVLDGLAPEVSWGMVGRAEDVPMAGLRHGKAGAADFFRIMAETVEMTSFEPREFLAAEDKVFISGHWSWIMRNNGRSGENDWLHVFTIRDGKVVSWRGHNDTGLLAAAYHAAPAATAKPAGKTEARKLVETLIDAFNRGDLPTIIAHFGEDCPLRETRAPELPYAGTFTGPAGAQKFFDGMLSALTPSRLDIDHWLCEGEHVVAMGSWAGTGRHTGKSFESHLALYFRVRDGKVIAFRGHDDTAVIAAALRR